MKKYRVKVNDKVYEVELEKVEEVNGSIDTTPSASPAPTSSGSSEGSTIDAPLQGKIFKVEVKVGDTIKSGDVVVVIEAMKMENEVQSHVSGTVKEILVNVGGEVETDQPLIVVE